MDWFRRLAAVPGLRYEPQTLVDRSSLPRVEAQPEVVSRPVDGTFEETLFWPEPGGSTSLSPSRCWMEAGLAVLHSAEEVRQRLEEALELPGTIADYCQVLGDGIHALWAFRGTTSWVPEESERFAQLALRLFEQHTSPGLRSDVTLHFALNVAAKRLIELRKREGYLRDALEIAQRAARLGVRESEETELRERILVMEMEDGAP